MEQLLAWWSFNNSDNDGDLLNATEGDSDARSNFGHMLDNNGFDDGFYDPAGPISGVTPQLSGIDALFPVASPGAGALIGEPDPDDDAFPDTATYGAYLDVTGLVGDNFAGSTSDNWGSFGGTALNRPDGSFSGGSLSVTGDANNGAFFDIRADLGDWRDVNITWANRGTGTGFDSRSVSVSTDGGASFTEIYADLGDLTSTWMVETADAGSLLDGASDAIIRFTLDGATSSSGNNRFDNIQLTGTAIGAASALVINELLVSHTGTDDTEFVELYGTPGTTLDGLSLIGIEGGPTGAGTIDVQIDFGAGDAIGENGFFLVGNPLGLQGNYGVAPDLEIAANTFENSPTTYALVETATLSGPSVSGSETVIDSVALTDGGTDLAFFFDAPVVGPDGSFLPAGARRVTDGVDTDTVADFALADFGLGPENTPTAGGSDTPPEEAELVLISAIQGTPDTQVVNRFGDAGSSPLIGENVRIEGVVTATFPDLNGFFLQEEASDSDGDARSSEGIFVFSPAGFVFEEGYTVSVTGVVDENFGMTQVEVASVEDIETLDAGDNLGLIDVPVIDRSDYGGNEDLTALEQFEGMKITFAQDMVVSEYFQLARFGQITLYEEERPYQFTQLNTPDVEGYTAYLDDLATQRIILDDGNNRQNAANPDGVVYYPQPGGLSTGTQGENFFRGGDVIEDLTGVLDWSFAGSGGTDAWRLRPTEADPVVFTPVNERPAAPEDVGGSLKVASFNVLNYFTTIDDGTNTTATGLEPRGADSEAELARQTAKIVDALATLGAQVYGLIEIENDDGASTAALVDALNARAGAGTYGFIDTGVIGTDAIKVALIFDQTKVRPVGDYAILDSSVDPRFEDEANRPALAQTFEEIGTTATFTAAVNHLKSKGSIFDGDAGIGDGAGNNDNVRTAAAEALADWLATDPTGSGDPDVMILGDLNAYAMEDPITALKEGADDVAGTADDFTDLLSQATDGQGYSYLFDGQIGTLDYALANTALAGQVTGATAWHTNADEVPLFDYNDAVLDASERSFEAEPSGNALYEPNAFRASDHDAVLVGLDLDPTFNVIAGTDRFDFLFGTDGRDLITSGGGRLDIVFGGKGADRFAYGDETSNGHRDRDVIFDYEVGLDEIDLGGAQIAQVFDQGRHVRIKLDGDGDIIFVKHVDDFDDIAFVGGDDFLFA